MSDGINEGASDGITEGPLDITGSTVGVDDGRSERLAMVGHGDEVVLSVAFHGEDAYDSTLGTLLGGAVVTKCVGRPEVTTESCPTS